MKQRKHPALRIIAILTALLLLAACGQNAAEATSAPSGEAQTQPQTGGEAEQTPVDAGAETPSGVTPVTLEIYSQPANFQGEQPGWTGKLLKERFGITLNIIAPQTAGSDIFAARSAAGFLGDAVVLDNIDIQSCIRAGLIVDFTAEMQTLTSFNDYKEQLDFYNSSLEGVNAGQYYAWPTEMTNTSPTTFSPIIPGVGPTIPWDYFKEVGAPDMQNLSDLVAVLRQIQDNHPTNADGDPSYGITLWPDWDGTSIENVNQLTKWYGEEVPEGQSSIMIDTEGNMRELTDDAGAYKRILQFYFEANQAGVVDPDSGTQNWDSVNSKFNSKRAFLIWNDWQQGFWNTSTRGNAGENFMLAPMADMKIYQPSDSYFGSGRAFACGTDDPAQKEAVRVLFEWMSSPDGLETIHGGIAGFSYLDSAEFGGFELTLEGETALMDNSPVPEEFGGGLYADGMLQVNQWMLAGSAKNPNNGIPFSSNYWPAQVEKNKTLTTNEWGERFDAENQMDYLLKNDLIKVVPFVNVSLAPDTSEISIIRTSCGPLVVDASWKMIFASDQAEFDEIWEQLKVELNGFGWADLVSFDKAKFQVLIDERARAME